MPYTTDLLFLSLTLVKDLSRINVELSNSMGELSRTILSAADGAMTFESGDWPDDLSFLPDWLFTVGAPSRLWLFPFPCFCIPPLLRRLKES